MRYRGTFKFAPAHVNYVFVATLGSLKLSYVIINQKNIKKTHVIPLYPPEIDNNHQYCLSGNQQSNIEKSEDIGEIERPVLRL